MGTIVPEYHDEMFALFRCDCVDLIARMPDSSVDLVVTSPPYDNLRKYDGFAFDVRAIALGLYRTVKDGGVVVWVVGDATVDGSETMTSFRHALTFREAGFRVHDTMIYQKDCPTWNQSCARYRQNFEYMFVFSKGKPKTFNPIRDVPVKNLKTRTCKCSRNGVPYYQTYTPKNEFAVRNNIWYYPTGLGGTTPDKVAFEHPAIFPERLAEDHVLSWSNEGDLVFDPFMGSGTTAKVALKHGRRCIGAEISERYCQITMRRLEDYDQVVRETAAAKTVEDDATVTARTLLAAEEDDEEK